MSQDWAWLETNPYPAFMVSVPICFRSNPSLDGISEAFKCEILFVDRQIQVFELSFM